MPWIEWPEHKDLAFTIRDDDISYFTQPWMLEAVYREAWRLGFKVSLAVVPYVKGTKLRLVPPKLRDANKFYPIGANSELITYLFEKMEKGQVDIIQHGYTHEKTEGTPEFARNNFAVINEKLRKGRDILQKTFRRRMSVFAAPHERICKATMESLIQNDMSLCRKFMTGRFLLNIPLSGSNLRRMAETVLHNPNPIGPMRENVFTFAGISIIQWDVFLMGKHIEAQIKEAENRLTKRIAMKDAFVIAHHYWEYFDHWEPESMRSERLQCFNEFLRIVKSKTKVWKTTLSEIDLLARKSADGLQP